MLPTTTETKCTLALARPKRHPSIEGAEPSLAGKWKVGQNRSDDDRKRASDTLAGQGGEAATAVAALMHAVLDSPPDRT